MTRRIAIVSNTAHYVGPSLARLLAANGHDLVIGDPVEGLVGELTALGAAIEVVENVRELEEPTASGRLVDAALRRFGRIDAAASFGGYPDEGPFLQSSIDDLHRAVKRCLDAPYNFLRAVAPVMVEQGSGQILVITSAFGARPTPGAALYSSSRAAAIMLVRSVAAEIVGKGVQVNSIGPNYIDCPESLVAYSAEDAEGLARLEATIPMGRLGQLDEISRLALPFLDGTSRFVTGHFVPIAGGWA